MLLQSSVSSAEQQLGASGQGPNRVQLNATPNNESQKNSLKRSFPVSPESVSDLSHNISPTGSPNRDGKQNLVNSAPPERVNEELWEMLLSIRRDTTKANDLAGALNDRLLIFEDSHDHAGADMLRMKHTLAEVVESNKVLAGRLMRAETTIERQREEIAELRMRSMRDNILFVPRVPNIRRCLMRIQLVCLNTLWLNKCTYQMLTNSASHEHIVWVNPMNVITG